MTELLAIIGILTISCLLLMAAKIFYAKFTTGLWPAEKARQLRQLELKSSETAHLLRQTKMERDYINQLNAKTEENKYLHQRLDELQQRNTQLVQEKNRAENALITFITDLKG